MDPSVAGAGSVVVVRAAKLRGISKGSNASSLYVEVAHEGRTNAAGQTRTTRCNASPSWNDTLTLPLDNLQQGCLRVSVCPGAPLTEEELAELAFEGKEPPPPLGYVRVPVADLGGLERSRPYTLEGTSDTAPGSITLGFAVVEDRTDDHESAGEEGGHGDGDGEGARETDPRSVSAIFSTSDCSVDPPLPLRSSAQSGFSRPEEQEEQEEDDEEVEYGTATTTPPQRREARPGPRHAVSGGAMAEPSRTTPRVGNNNNSRSSSSSSSSSSSRVGGGGGGGGGGGEVRSGGGHHPSDDRRAREEEKERDRPTCGSTSSEEEGLNSKASPTPAEEGPPRRYPGGGGGGGDGGGGGSGSGPGSGSGSAFSEEEGRGGDGHRYRSVRHHDGGPSEGTTGGGGSNGREEHESGTDDSGDLSSEGIAALLQVIAREEKKAGETNGVSPGMGPTGGGGGGGGHRHGRTTDSSGGSHSFDSGSSSNFEFSPAHPVYAAGDLWGSSGGGAGASYHPEESRGRGAPSAHVMDTPRREAAERLKVLIATVAATVAEVAAETYDRGSNQHGFLNTSSNATGNVLGSSSSDDDEDDSSSRNPLGGLPMAGSRSPREGTAPAAGIARPGRREPHSESDLSYQEPKSNPRRGSAEDSSSDGFTGGLPLAGSRSPPAVRGPGRREPDSSDVSSSDVQISAAAAAAVARNNSPRRGGKRPQRRRPKGEDQWQRSSLPVAAGTGTTAAPANEPSVMTSAPLDLSSPQMSGSRPVGGGGGGGRRQRDAEYRAEGRLLHSRNRSENSWWEKELSTTGEESGGGLGTGGERRRGRQAGAVLGTTRRPAHKPSKPSVTVVVAGRNNNPPSRRSGGAAKKKEQRPSVVWRQVAGGRWAGGTTTVAAGEATATATAVVAEEPGPGLRATHFAPGYIGVAWPDPLEAGGAGGHMAVARDRLLAKLEEASARKIADVEERSLRARRERAERLKRRNSLQDKNVRREIKNAMEEQERRLQRQLEAARRRQAGAEAAADAAALAAKSSTTIREAGTVAGGSGGGAARERAEAVRRRRAMLEADEARAKIYAFKRRGELRTQALLRGVVQGAASKEDIAAAAEAFEVAAEGAGAAGGGKKGAAAAKGAVIASGAPRSTWESWNEQRRTKAEEIRLQGTIEEAFKALDGVAALRRENAVGARRDRARESNARADEGHGRAGKRLRMQAETTAARVEARAREAAVAASAAEAQAEAAKRERARRGREIEAKKKELQQQEQREQQQQQRHQRPRRGGRRGSRSGRRRGGREEPRGRRGEENARRADRGRPSLVEVLGEAKAVMDDEDEDGGRRSENDGARGDGAQQPRGGRGGGALAEVWMPSTTAVRREEARSPTAQARVPREPAWAEEDKAVARRLEHLDMVAARLEEAGAEIEANIELLGVEHGRPRSAANHYGSNNNLPDYYDQGWTRTGETLGREERRSRLDLGGGGGGRVRRRRDKEGGTPAAQRSLGTARGRLKVRGGVVSRRLVAPTVSSKNKAKPSSGGGGAATRDRGTTPSRSPTRHRVQKNLASSRGRREARGRNDDLSELFAGRGGRAMVGGGVRDGGQAISRNGRAFSEERPTRVRQGGRRGGEQNGDSISTAAAAEESPERRSTGRAGSGRLLSSRDGDDGDDSDGEGGVGGGGDRDRLGGDGERESEASEQEEEMRASSGRRGRTRSESRSLSFEEDQQEQEQGLLWESTRSRARYSEEHKEAMESVSSDAMRMRAIKDDLSDVLQRLREGDMLSAAATAAAVAPVARKPLPAGLVEGQSGARGEEGDGELEELATAFYGTASPPRNEEQKWEAPSATAFTGDRRGRASSRQQQQQQVPPGKSSFSPVGAAATTAAAGTSMTLQVSALADLEARIASLGGLLNSFSSEDGGDGGSSTQQPQHHHNHNYSSASSSRVIREGAGGALLRPSPSLPPPQERQQEELRSRSTSPVPLALMRAKASSSSVSSSSPRYNAYDDGGREEEEEGSAGGSSRQAFSSSAGGGGDGRRGGETTGVSVAAETAELSGAASDLAREVDALLRASGSVSGSVSGSGSGSGSGGSGDSVANDVSTAAGVGEEEKTEASSLGWGELEGMAHRLGFLAAGGDRGAGVKGGEGMLGNGGGSGYSSSRELGSVSSRG